MSKEVKKKSNSKLSLRKKGRPNNENLVSISEADLNETSEFQRPRHATSGFHQPNKVRQGRQLKQQKAQSKESKDLSEDKVSSKEKPEEQDCVDTKEKVDDNIDDVGEESKDVNVDDPGDSCRCLSCGQFFTQAELKGHIQKCLKSRFDRKTRPVTGRADGRRDEEMTENREFKENEGKIEEDNSYFCLFCKKDLSHLNSGLKTQHLNRCMDKKEKEKQEEERKKLELERAKKAVLSCPICGKPSKTENARKVHLKKCATANSVTTEQVLKLVKDQEEEHRVKLAAGIIPTDMGKVKTTTGTNAAGTKSRKAKEPKSQFDEDTQLAMAISSSLKQDEKEKESDLIGQTLGTEQAMAWNLQAMENDNKRRKKRKKGEPEGIPLLLALSEEEKTRRQELRVSNLLVPQDEEEEFENTPTMGDSDLQNQTGTTNLWTTSSLGNKQMEDFYVSSLIPPIEKSKTVVGAKIRRMSEIPGRRKSVLPSNSDEIDGDVTMQRDVLMATTQTAVVLAELAELAEQEMLDTTIHCSGFCPEKAINIESTTKIEAMRRVQTDMLGLVNNPTGSDVTILVADREELYAHSIILSCRCLTLLQMKKGSEISMLDISYEVMLSVLKFVYAGDISLYHSNVSQVLSLSKRLDLDELTSICEEVLTHISEEMDQSSDGQNDDAINSHQSDVDKLLKDVWGEEKEEKEKEDGPSSEASLTKSDHNDTGLSQPKQYKHSGVEENQGSPRPKRYKSLDKHSGVEENQGSPRPKRYKPSDVDENRVTSTIGTKDSPKKLQNKAQDDPVCEDEVDTMYSTQGRFLQEIENFFQDDSFNMSCEDTGTKSVGTKTRCEMVENNELVSDSSSDSASDVCIGSSSNDTCKQSQGSDQTIADIKQDRKTTTVKSSQRKQQTNAEIIPEEKKDDDAIIICSDESDTDIIDDRNLISDHSDDGNDTKQEKSGIILKKKDVDSFDKNSDSDSEGVISTTRMSFQHSEDNSPSSPELIEEDDAACTILSSSSPSRKRKRISFTNKVKSPVVTVVSPSKTSSTPTADTSGVDLFGSPSPCNKRRKTESPGKLEVSTSSFLHQEKSGTRKLFSSDEPSDSLVSRSDSPVSEQPCEPTDIIDVECMKEVVQQTSQGSPIFQGKVKKKWKFTKTNFNSVQATTSPLKIQNPSPKAHQRRSSELSPSQRERSPICSPENKAVWMEVSPVKHSQENNTDSKHSSPEASHDASIPQDIWDNFDDSGAGFGGICDIPNASNSFTEHNSSVDQDNIETMTNSKIPQSLAAETPKLPRHKVKTPAQDTSPRIDSDDSFVIGDDSVPNVSFYKDCEAKMSFKTPTAISSRQKAGIQWVPPSPFTPMPQYDSMNTPQLKKAIQKIGVRPVGKKRMVALLKDVYEKTHQYETDSNFEDDEDEDEGEEESSGAKDQEADELNSSQGSSQSDMVEESYLQGPTDDIMSSQMSSQQDDSDLSDKLYQFVTSCTDIYRKILMYEPLEVDWLKKEIKDAGIKCSMQKLLDFLDEKCITFTMKKMRKERKTRRGRDKSKTSPKKGTSPLKKRSPRKGTSPSKKRSPKKKVTSKRKKASPQKNESDFNSIVI